MPAGFDGLWAELVPLGRHRATGGYRRYSWTSADAEVRAWFAQAAEERGLAVDTDRNGNMWAWWGRPGDDAVVTGSHLDSVPDGGAFDGPLGVVSALAAVEELRRRGVRPRRPLAVAVFVEEEGARFGVPCLGSRLLSGAVTPQRAAGLTDADGITWSRAMDQAGLNPEGIGPDPELLSGIGVFLELHIEQGRALAPAGRSLGVASAIWPHGRWCLDFSGRADHAGTTRIVDRRDPILPFAETVLAARRVALDHDALATIGKVHLRPNGTNAIPSHVRAWLDARAPAQATLQAVVGEVEAAALRSADDHGVVLTTTEESQTPVVQFHEPLRERVAALIGGPDGPAPILPTGAGHDAGVLAAALPPAMAPPTAMLFVRNPTGVSHSPEEFAEPVDCHAGVAALADTLAELLGEG